MTKGQYVTVGEEVGHSTYWWISTLAALNNLLTGSNSSPKVVVGLGPRRRPTIAWSDVRAAPATYTEPTFTPPRLSGRFRIPFSLVGGKRVTVSVTQIMLGIPLSNSAISKVKIVG